MFSHVFWNKLWMKSTELMQQIFNPDFQLKGYFLYAAMFQEARYGKKDSAWKAPSQPEKGVSQEGVLSVELKPARKKKAPSQKRKIRKIIYAESIFSEEFMKKLFISKTAEDNEDILELRSWERIRKLGCT